MQLIHKYQRKLEKAGALTRYTQYKYPVYIWSDPNREARPMNPDTPRAESAISRTRYTIYHLIRCNQQKVNIFVTLTYKENELSLKKAKKDFKNFILKLNYETGQSSKYVCIPERQTRGAVHFHVLFFGLPYRPLSIFKALWPHGDARFERSRQLRSIASYVAKYVTKHTFDFPKGTRIIMRSRNLIIPNVYIEGLTSFPDVVDFRQPVLITTGKLKKVTIYDNQSKINHYRKNRETIRL